MMPSMRSIAIMFVLMGLFMSCLAATGCGDDLPPAVESCDDVAQVLCPVLNDCGNLAVSEQECYEQLPAYCDLFGYEAWDLSDLSCEAMADGEYLPVGAGPG